MTPSVPINRMSLKEMAYQAGLGSSLKLCLDPACAESYPGSGQILYDISGNGYDYWLGTDSGVTADPTFNGTAGSLTNANFFSSAGSTGFMAVNANDAFMNGLHKAGYEHTLVCLDYWNGANYGASFNTKSGGLQKDGPGVSVFMTVSTQVQQVIGSGSGTLSNVIAASPPANAVFMFGFSRQWLSLSSRNSRNYLNGTYAASDSVSGNFTTSTADGVQARFGLTTDNSSYLAVGRRVYGVMMFDTLFGQAQFDALRAQFLSRHPGV